ATTPAPPTRPPRRAPGAPQLLRANGVDRVGRAAALVLGLAPEPTGGTTGTGWVSSMRESPRLMVPPAGCEPRPSGARPCTTGMAGGLAPSPRTTWIAAKGRGAGWADCSGSPASA